MHDDKAIWEEIPRWPFFVQFIVSMSCRPIGDGNRKKEKKKMKIYVRKNEEEWEEVIPLPVEGDFPLWQFANPEVRVCGRLASTRGGANANWQKKGAVVFSKAPYCPFIDLTFSGKVGLRFLGWHNHSALEIPDAANYAVSWGGTLEESPAVVWGDSVTDNSKRVERCSLFEEAKTRIAAAIKQGNLSIRRIDPSTNWISKFHDLAKYNERPISLSGHYICPPQYWVGLDYSRIIHLNERGATVTSFDHPLGGLELTSGFYLIEYPLPG